MTDYTVDVTSAGTMLQSGSGILSSITMVTPPQGRNYLCLVDTGVEPPNVLFNKEPDNPALGNKQPMDINAQFSELYCASVPAGATYTVTTS